MSLRVVRLNSAAIRVIRDILCLFPFAGRGIDDVAVRGHGLFTGNVAAILKTLRFLRISPNVRNRPDNAERTLLAQFLWTALFVGEYGRSPRSNNYAGVWHR